VRILSRRFLASYLSLFAITLAAMTTITIIFETLVDFDKIVEYRDAAGGVFSYLFVRIPALYLRDLIPLASFVAAFLCLGGAARANEITAAKTGGIPPLRLALPLILAATALSAGALLINETWLLAATREFDRIHHPGNEVSYQRGSFWYHRGRTFYNVTDANKRAGTLLGVSVYELDERGRLLESLRAERVRVQDDDDWLMIDAVRRRFDPSSPAARPIREILDVALIDATNRDTLSLLDARENSLSLMELVEVIGLRNDEARNALRFRTMLHSRLATPFTVLLFALLAIPLGLSVERTGSMAVSVLYGFSAIALFHACWRTGILLAGNGFELAVTAPWLVLAVFAGFSALLMARSPS
jgi:lipopolysaccharide export system permease protein